MNQPRWNRSWKCLRSACCSTSIKACSGNPAPILRPSIAPIVLPAASTRLPRANTTMCDDTESLTRTPHRARTPQAELTHTFHRYWIMDTLYPMGQWKNITFYQFSILVEDFRAVLDALGVKVCCRNPMPKPSPETQSRTPGPANLSSEESRGERTRGGKRRRQSKPGRGERMEGRRLERKQQKQSSPSGAPDQMLRLSLG